MPWWRYIGIMHMSANPEHPFHVAVGNNKVLKDDPKERGVDLYEEMLKLYHEFYSANGMTACVIGKESLAELEAMVRDKFSDVVDKGLSLPLGDAVSDKPPFLPQDWNRLLLQCPVKDVKQLTFAWILPYQAPMWRSKPTAYVSHLLGHEGKGSLTAILKERGIISGCYCGNGAWLEGAFSILNVQFDLTDKGLHAVEEIGTLMFLYITMLQQSDVKAWIFGELQKLREIMFRFENDRGPFDQAARIAGSLQHHPPSEALAGGILLYEPDAASTASVLARLTLDSVRVTHQAKALEDRCTDKDTSYDSPMKFEPLPDAWRAAWTEAMSATGPDAAAAAAKQGLHLPEPNPFVPEDLAVKALPQEPVPLPVRLPPAGGPIRDVFHRQDDVFKQPKARVSFLIRSPFISECAENYVKVDLWSFVVGEALAEYAYDAEVAGVNYSLGVSSGALSLAFSGFHDKLPALIKAVSAKMREMAVLPENFYRISADAYGDQLRNSLFHSRPISQCGLCWSNLTTRGMSFPLEACYDAFQGITRESLESMCPKIFSSCHVESMVLGNTTPADAQGYARVLSESLGVGGPLSKLPEQAEATLPLGRTVWTCDSTDKDDPNHAVMLKIQLAKSLGDEALLLVFNKVLSSKFFDVLRTQQQLGYIVGMGGQIGVSFNYLVAQVQTEFEPNYTRGRIDAFFDEHFDWIESGLSLEELETCCAGVLSELKTKPKNLSEEFGKYSRHWTYRTYAFGHRAKLIEFLERGVALDQLRSFLNDKVRSAPRMYVQVKKVLEKEDKPLPEGAVTPEDPPDLRRWTGVEDAAVKEFKASTEWVAINDKVDV